MSQSDSQSSMASMVELAINKEQKERLAAILKHVSRLSDLEKLYLYLKLPTGQASEEPSKRSCVPTPASTSRMTTTLTWIRCHYVEDKNVCMPKQEVYTQYRLYCDAIDVNPVGSADFGKMVKTAFPNIHHRRLGQRGKSKYCWGGLRRKTQIELPTLPVLQTKPIENPATVTNPLQEMQHLSGQLICEWACKLFDKKFTDIKSLAQYLIQSGASYGKKAALFSMMYDSSGTTPRHQETKSSDPKLQDTHALLQRKLHQKEVLKEHMNLLKQQQKDQRRAGSVSVTPVEITVSNLHTSCLQQNDAGKFVSNYQCDDTPKLAPSIRSESAKLVDTVERVAHTFKESYEVDVENTSLSSQGNCPNNRSDNVNSQERSFQNRTPKSQVSYCETDRRPEKHHNSFRERSANVNMSSDSDVSRESPQSSLEVDDHKHQKRVGEVLTGTSHERVSKRRRCMTSLGMPHQELTEDQTSGSESAELVVEPRIRPFSCPTLYDALFLSSDAKYINKSASKETFTSQKRQSLSHWKERSNCKSLNKQMSSKNEEVNPKTSSSKATKTKSDKSSFHFVQKPTVIAVRHPGTLFPSVMSCPNFTSSQKSEQDSLEASSDIKKTHNILNTLLSSDTDPNSFPKPNLSTPIPLSSMLSQSVHQLNSFDHRVDQQEQKLPHTLDNAYILSSQSNRSAFVPVASNKLQDFSRSRSSQPCLNTYSPSTCSSGERLNIDANHSPRPEKSENITRDLLLSSDDETMKDDKQLKENATPTVSERTAAQIYSVNCSMVDTSVDHFKPISYSLSQGNTPVSSVISNHSSFTPTPMVSCSPVSQTKMSTQILLSNSTTSGLSKQPAKTGSKSPVTPPRRQSRSRFTPIRPKINGCTPSPQKKDMRPVSTILKEQRVRNAQELLVNLANSYQGEVQLQMPAELLGLTPAGKKSDVLVTIGTPSVQASNPPSSLPSVSSNKEIKLLLQPQSQTAPCVTPPLSSLPLSSSNVNAPVTNVQLVSNNEKSQHGTPLPKMSSRHPLLPAQMNPTDTASSNSQVVIVPSDSSISTTQLQENSIQGTEFVIADSNGTIYTVDKDSQPFPLPQNMKNVLETESSNKSGSSSSFKMTHNVINISDINGQVIGPDDTGQTYLIIPSSDATSEVQNQTSTVIDSAMGNPKMVTGTPSVHSSARGESSLLPSVPKVSQDNVQTMSSAIGSSSSSALLSELSQLASASKKEKSQTLIKHDSAVSAFHKCAPNKQQTIASGSSQEFELCLEGGIADTLENFVEIGLLNSQFSLPVSGKQAQSATDPHTCLLQSATSDSHRENAPSQCQSVRKRKASKSRVMGMKDKKRQNTSKRHGRCSEDDDVVIVDMEKETPKPEEIFLEDSHAKDVKETESTFSKEGDSLKSQGKNEIDFLDTDSLLQRISGSRSLTVKQTVMAINSLKAEMKKKLQGVNEYNSGSQTDWMTRSSQAQGQPEEVSSKKDFQLPYDHLKDLSGNVSTSGTTLRVPSESLVEDRLINNQTVVDKPRQAPKISRSNRRNMSLNLESLESDALLDNEPTLDHRLVGDVGDNKSRKSENKMSVAVVAKTPQASLPQRQESSGKKSQGSRSTYTNSAEVLGLYQPTAKEKKVGVSEGSKKSTESRRVPVESSRKSSHMSKSSHTSSSGALSLPRRSLSCVRDILERGTSSSVLDQKKSERSGGIEKSCGAEYFDALLSKMQSKSNEAIDPGNVLKSKSQTHCDLDIPIDVVDFVTESMSSQNIYNFQSSRCVSVPNTRPDFCNLDKSGNLMWTQRLPSLDVSENINTGSGEGSLLFLDDKQGDSLSEKGDDPLCSQSDEQAHGGKQNVFLSPVGPAKLARRLSIEKSVAQPPVDRSMSKTPVEISHPKISLEPASVKCSGMKGQSVDRQSARTPVDRAMNYTERKRAKTPFDTTMNFQTNDKKSGKLGLTSQTSEELTSPKLPINRSLTRTPMDKFFHKIVSDSLLTKYHVENLNQQYSRDQNNDDYLSSQTPTSDAGYGSVSETPVSDFGYNSISPSPVMMSSSSFFGECGRRDITSPATIFMPLRSDSALSLNNNVNSEHPICPPQANLSDILPSVSNQYGGDNFPGESDQSEMNSSASVVSSTRMQDATHSQQANNLDLQVFLEKQHESTNSNEISNAMDFSKLVSLHNIPTPPFSPNSALMTSAPTTLSPLQFSIPFSPLPNHDNSPSPPSIPRFLLPSATNTSTSSTISLHLHHSSSSPPRRFGPQDQQSPSIAHVLTPSPHILARPPSSPHQFGTHPSPPFTPSSQRSLPSPCPTPSSFKSLISPRSVTPSVDPNQAPNGFMPIQSSCVQTPSLAPTHAYIQPIKPVVTLASPSSHVSGGSESQTGSSELSLGILSPSVGTQHDDRRHIYGRRTPSISSILARENVVDTRLQTFSSTQTDKFRSSTSKAFHSTVTNHRSSSSARADPSGFSYQDNLYLSDSSFTVVPSKLQVDLAKLETRQNPTSTVQSKSFHSRQCKINLDNCDTSSSIQISPVGQRSYSNINSLICPNNNALLFDPGKEEFQKSSDRDLTSLNTPPVTNIWGERLTKSCQDDLQATLEVLKDMDGQYFPSDEDNSNGGCAS